MADDIARLGIQIDSSQAVSASKNLDALADKSGKAEKATDSLRRTGQAVVSALASLNSTLEKATAILAQNTSAIAANTNATNALAASNRVVTVASTGAAGAVATTTNAIVGNTAVIGRQITITEAAATAQAELAETTATTATAQTAAADAAAAQASAVVAATTTMAESLGALGTIAVRTAAAQVEGAQAAAAAAVESAVIQKAANDSIHGSSTALRESITLLREASVGNFTRMAGSASILLQALGLLERVLIPLGAAAVVLGGGLLLATNQINSGVKGTGDLTRGLGLTADQLEKVQNRYVSFGDTAKAVGQVLWADIGGAGLSEAVQNVWNGIASFIAGTMEVIVGGVVGSVRVIEEAWKAMPKALGGTGTTAGIDFQKAFQGGLDDSKAALNKFYTDVAAQARKNAISRIQDEAGKATGTSGDHQIDGAEKQLAEARNQLSAQTALNDAVQSGSLTIAEMTKQEKIDADMKQIVAQRDADLIKNTQKSREEADALTKVIAQLRPVYSALYDQQMAAKQIAANDNMRQQNDLLEYQISLAGQNADARALEIAQYKEIQSLRQRGIDPNSSLGQSSIAAVNDNTRRQQGLQRSSLLNEAPDQGTQLGTRAAQVTLANDPASYVKEQAAAYEEIDKLRQQDVLNETQAAQAKAKVDSDIASQRLSAAQEFFGNLASLSQSSNHTLAAIGKAAAITQATIDGVLAVQKALASYPPPYNFAMAAAVGVATAANVAKIAGFADGVVDVKGPGTSTSDSILARLSNGESVVTAQATSRNRNTLAAMNDGAAFDAMLGRSANSNSGPRITIQQMPGVVLEEAPGLTEDDVVLIARREVKNGAPAAAAASARDPNGVVAKANRDTIKAPRRRA